MTEMKEKPSLIFSDHTEFRVLAIQPNYVCRKFLLRFAVETRWLMNELLLLYWNPVSQWFSVLPGFGPAAEPLLFRQK